LKKKQAAKRSHFSHQVFKKGRKTKMSEIEKQPGYVGKVPDEFAMEINFCNQAIILAEKQVELERERLQGRLMRMYAKLGFDPDNHVILPADGALNIICKNPTSNTGPKTPMVPPVDQPGETKPADNVITNEAGDAPMGDGSPDSNIPADKPIVEETIVN